MSWRTTCFHCGLREGNLHTGKKWQARRTRLCDAAASQGSSSMTGPQQQLSKKQVAETDSL